MTAPDDFPPVELVSPEAAYTDLWPCVVCHEPICSGPDMCCLGCAISQAKQEPVRDA